MNGRDDDLILAVAVGGQAGDQAAQGPERPVHLGGPGLVANAYRLDDADLLARLDLLEDVEQVGAQGAGGADQAGQVGHSTSPLLSRPRTRAMRPVRANSWMP